MTINRGETVKTGLDQVCPTSRKRTWQRRTVGLSDWVACGRQGLRSYQKLKGVIARVWVGTPATGEGRSRFIYRDSPFAGLCLALVVNWL